MELKPVDIMGVRVHPLERGEFLGLIEERLRGSGKALIANHNLHSVYLFHRLAPFREFYRRALCVHADGMPLIFWARFLGHDVKRSQRLTYVDFAWPLLDLADRMRKSVFILGGRQEMGAKALDMVRRRFPDLRVAFQHGYFPDGGQEETEVLERISAFAPDVLMVGLGMPRQEVWISRNWDRIQARLVFNSGACFDYLTGTIRTPPRWSGRLGLEWLFRLFSTPRRVVKRYLWEPWFLVPLLVKDILRKRRANG